MVGEREILFETDTFIAYGELLKDPPHEPKYHVWIYPKNHIEFSEGKIKEIIENLKDFGKWRKFKQLKKDLEN